MEKKKLLKNKIVDTLPMLYLETVILMVLGQFLGSFILGIPVGIAIAAHPQLLEVCIFEYDIDVCDLFGNLGSGIVLDSDRKREIVRSCRRSEQNHREITENICCSDWFWDLH